MMTISIGGSDEMGQGGCVNRAGPTHCEGEHLDDVSIRQNQGPLRTDGTK